MLVRIFFVVIVALIGVACGTSLHATFDNTQWQLHTIDGRALPDALSVTMDFTAETFGGSGFCNQYGGRYRVTGNTIVLTDIASTMMACLDDSRNQLEQQHMVALGRVRTFVMKDQTLTLFDDTQQPILQFVRLSP